MTTQVIINILDYNGGGTPPVSDPTLEGLYLPDAYEATEFYAVIEFLIEETIPAPGDGEAEVITSPATSVTSTFDFDYYGMTYTQVNANAVRLDGPIINVFQDQFYQFVKADGSTPTLPFDTEDEFYSLIKYQKPSENTTLFAYDFLVNAQYNTIIYQWINWSYQSAVNNITNLSTKGTL